MWSLIGALASLLLAAFAWWRSGKAAGHYDGEVYGMTPAVHRRYAAAAVLLAVAFGLSSLWHGVALVPLGGAGAILALIYLTSFLRGAESDV